MIGTGKAGRTERLLCQPQHDDRVLAAREEQHWALKLRGDLTHDVNRLGFQLIEVADPGMGRGGGTLASRRGSRHGKGYASMHFRLNR